VLGEIMPQKKAGILFALFGANDIFNPVITGAWLQVMTHRKALSAMQG